MSDIQFWLSGDWTMVYLDGELVRAGDHYLADEWLQQHVGVTRVEDEAGICIPDGHHATRNLAEVMAAVREHEARAEVAAAKRAEAQRLLDEAKELETQR